MEGKGFSEVWNSNYQYALQCQFAPPCQISCRSLEPFRRYGRLINFSRWRPCAIMDFQKLEMLTAHTLLRAKMHHRANFCPNRSTRCGNMAVFDFSRWRPFAILDLFTSVWPTHEVYFGGLCHCAKFGLNRCSSLDNMKVLIF